MLSPAPSLPFGNTPPIALTDSDLDSLTQLLNEVGGWSLRAQQTEVPAAPPALPVIEPAAAAAVAERAASHVESSRELHPVLRQRDPELIRRAFPYVAGITDHYFRAEVDGVEHLPQGAAMVVSTHNGGIVMPDFHALSVAYWRRFGAAAPAYGMMHRLGLQIPKFGAFFRALGAIEASRENARIVLESGFPLLVCPGGDVDSLRPFRQRHQVSFGQRRGFIRLAIEQQVPIVPVVSVGAHEIFFVLNDGRRLARALGVDRLFRLKTLPLTLSFPLGLTPGGLLSIPLPSKISIRVLPRIELPEPPAAAADGAVVERCFQHVRRRMQRALDELAARRKHVILG